MGAGGVVAWGEWGLGFGFWVLFYLEGLVCGWEAAVKRMLLGVGCGGGCLVLWCLGGVEGGERE
jgi:hypothetical protein